MHTIREIVPTLVSTDILIRCSLPLLCCVATKKIFFSTQRECKFFIFMCENFFVQKFQASELFLSALIAFRSSKLHSFSHAESYTVDISYKKKSAP